MNIHITSPGEPRLQFGDRSLHNDVYTYILEQIHSGMLVSGDRISEAGISRELGISRAPVREAVSRLSHEGILVRRPRRGAVVRTFTREDLADIEDTRQLLEGHAARRACQRITSEDIKSLENVVRLMSEVEDTSRWIDSTTLNMTFHQTVVRIAGNSMLLRLWESLHPLAWFVDAVVRPNTRTTPKDLASRHHELLLVLREGNGDRAAATFQEHVLEIARRRRKGMAEKVDPTCS